jgi:outer membrane protein assembly factor BamC
MTRFRTLVLAAMALPLLAGCGLFGGRSEDYKATRIRETPLEVPPDLTTPTYDDRFAIPDPKASTSFSQYQQGRAPGSGGAGPVNLAVLPPIANVRIERSGELRYIVAKADPGQAWPVVREFWLDQGFAIAREDPSAGVLETNWRENRPPVESEGYRGFMSRYLPGMFSSGERDRFRARIERGAEAGTVEIYVSHRGLEEVFTSQYQDSTRWVPRGSGTDRDLEAEMLQKLVLKLGEPTRKPEAVRAADAKPGQAPVGGASAARGSAAPIAPASQNAVLQGAGAGPIVLNDGFDRAWRRVGLALDRVGFTVEDRDRSKGTYFVRYIDPDAAKVDNDGFLDKLTFWRPAPKAAAPQFRIGVTDAGGGFTNVMVQDAQGANDATPTGKRILSLLYEQLK